jgi:hypothetical protein
LLVPAEEVPEYKEAAVEQSVPSEATEAADVSTLATQADVHVTPEDSAALPSEPVATPAALSVAAEASPELTAPAIAPNEVASTPSLPEQTETPPPAAGEVTRRHSVKLSTALPVLSDPFPFPAADGTGDAVTPEVSPMFVPVAVLPTIPATAPPAAPVEEEAVAVSAATAPSAADSPERSQPSVQTAAAQVDTHTHMAIVAPTSASQAEDKPTLTRPAAAALEPAVAALPKSELPVPGPEPAPARTSSTSPLRLSTKTQAAGAAAGGTSPLQRVNTSTGTGASSKSSTSTVSPLRRTSSLTGSQTVPSKKSTWYPGKFILEGPSAWSGKAKPMLKMNPDAARNHYAELMSSSARDFTDEQLAASASQRADSTGALAGGGLSPKMSTSQQREEELRSAQLPDMVAAGSSDDTIDMVLRLSRENGQLKREVAHLRAELERQQAIIESLRRGESATGDATPTSASTTMAEKDAPSVPTASLQGVPFAEPGAADPVESAVPALNKARSSRRFAGRGYYSSYQDGEDEEDLFGDDDDKLAEKSPNFKFAEFAMDDLNSEGTESNGTFGSARKSRLNSFGSGAGGDAEADQNLDLLLKSVTGSGVKEKDRRSLDAQKYLVQSFMSTSTITPQETKQERIARSDQGQGDWQERFGSLGLISSDAKVRIICCTSFVLRSGAESDELPCSVGLSTINAEAVSIA